MKPFADFGKAGGRVFRLEDVALADFSNIEQLEAKITLKTGETLDVFDIEALELAMQIKPTVLESKRLRYAKWAWLVHNLLAHPLMQLLALCKAYKWAFYVHDRTVPMPKGAKKSRAG